MYRARPATPSKVECCGPQCKVIVTLIVAKAEKWVIYSKGALHPSDSGRRDFLGWCRRCADKYGVE